MIVHVLQQITCIWCCSHLCYVKGVFWAPTLACAVNHYLMFYYQYGRAADYNSYLFTLKHSWHKCKQQGPITMTDLSSRCYLRDYPHTDGWLHINTCTSSLPCAHMEKRADRKMSSWEALLHLWGPKGHDQSKFHLFVGWTQTLNRQVWLWVCIALH